MELYKEIILIYSRKSEQLAITKEQQDSIDLATAQINEIIKVANTAPLNSFILERRDGAHLLNGFHPKWISV